MGSAEPPLRVAGARPEEAAPAPPQAGAPGPAPAPSLTQAPGTPGSLVQAQGPPPSAARTGAPARPRNDPGQYDDLSTEWWKPRGVFAMLHWIAEARAQLIPPAPREGAILLDLACGAGLLAPHVAGKGYTHVGVDLSPTALPQAAAHGVLPVRGDVLALPFPDGCADVVSAGEILEHVPDLPAAVAEACRVLRPGGLLVVDTIAATFAGRFITVTLAERIPGLAPKGIHDPALFVDRRQLIAECARHGVPLRLRGLRPSAPDLLFWLARRTNRVRMLPTFSTSVLFQGHGVKAAGSASTAGT